LTPTGPNEGSRKEARRAQQNHRGAPVCLTNRAWRTSLSLGGGGWVWWGGVTKKPLFKPKKNYQKPPGDQQRSHPGAKNKKPRSGPLKASGQSAGIKNTHSCGHIQCRVSRLCGSVKERYGTPPGPGGARRFGTT